MNVLTYRLVCFVGLAQGGRSTVHLLNHAGKVLAHLVQALRELLGKFVTIHYVSGVGSRKEKALVLTLTRALGQVLEGTLQGQPAW